MTTKEVILKKHVVNLSTIPHAIEKQVPGGKPIYVIVNNYPSVSIFCSRRWLQRHPRWMFHFTRRRPSALKPLRVLCNPHQVSAQARASSAPSSTSKPRSTAFSKSAISGPGERLDRRPRYNHRRHQTRASSVSFDPLATFGPSTEIKTVLLGKLDEN